MRTAWRVGSSVLLFLAAAKAHGRELRLERVAAGVEHVVFGGTNPPFVEALWRAERLRFWIAVPFVAAGVAAILKARGHTTASVVIGALAWAPALTFTVLGVLSLARAGLERGGHAGSLVWWSVVVAAGVLAASALKRAATTA